MNTTKYNEIQNTRFTSGIFYYKKEKTPLMEALVQVVEDVLSKTVKNLREIAKDRDTWLRLPEFTVASIKKLETKIEYLL